MAIISVNENKESNIPVLPVGTYPAVISAVWDIGKQKKVWEGETSIINQIIIRVEVSKKIEAEGEYNGKRYAPLAWVAVPKAYSDKSNLVKIANSALGKTLTAKDFAQFDTDSLIGKNVVVNIQHTKGGNAKVAGFSPAMDGFPTMTPELTPETPEWVQKKFNEGIEAQTQQELPPVSSYSQPAAPEDDLPW